jgi:hypothetical protein
MAFEIGSTLNAVATYVQKSGLFHTVQIGEPKSPPGQGYHAAIFMRSAAINLVYAGGDTRENHTITLRIYRDMLAEQTDSQQNLENEMAVVVSKLMSDLCGDSDLESTVMTIDIAGMDGSVLRAEYGYLDVGGTMYRMCDVTVPLVVNGSATVAGTGV